MSAHVRTLDYRSIHDDIVSFRCHFMCGPQPCRSLMCGHVSVKPVKCPHMAVCGPHLAQRSADPSGRTPSPPENLEQFKEETYLLLC
ncbi:BQ5605_C002g01096 [Microbotryum silenes-dioicae]|uniref:BQ5605_C002g01096 protein n=1 Tax=Microbotryum silenes-dioicae TaxID=796604 RepID=A0A2X0LXQ1_9BASI|nr:BQ5605_C002g01096 [Microbotryum silenes-dioicae]